MGDVPAKLRRELKRVVGLEWEDLTGSDQQQLLKKYSNVTSVGDWEEFFAGVGLVDKKSEDAVFDAIQKEEKERYEQELKVGNVEKLKRYEKIDKQYTAFLNYVDTQLTRGYARHVFKRDYTDTPTLNLLKTLDKKHNSQLALVYESDYLLPMNALNKTYPIKKRISNETGWDRFVNSLSKGWHKFVKWFCETGWKILLSIAIDIIIGCIPGVGTLLGMVARTGADVMLDILDAAKSSAERAHLQRAIEEGKSRGLDEWDEMFMWRSMMIILILTIARDNSLIIDGEDLKSLFRSRPEFMEKIQNQEFLKGLWAVQSQAVKDLVGEDPDGNPDFERVPEDVAETRSAAMDLYYECVEKGTVFGYSGRDLKGWLG